MILKPTTDHSLSDGRFTIFLAGSIEMGKAEDWQTLVTNELEKIGNICLLNPRRDDWDASWEQDISNHPFQQQVTWELDGLEKADLILFYFSPETQSPITLLELGLFAKTEKIVVCCPDGFWRKGNIDIVCDRYAIPQVNSIDELINYAHNCVLNQQISE